MREKQRKLPKSENQKHDLQHSTTTHRANVWLRRSARFHHPVPSFSLQGVASPNFLAHCIISDTDSTTAILTIAIKFYRFWLMYLAHGVESSTWGRKIGCIRRRCDRNRGPGARRNWWFFDWYNFSWNCSPTLPHSWPFRPIGPKGIELLIGCLFCRFIRWRFVFVAHCEAVKVLRFGSIWPRTATGVPACPREKRPMIWISTFANLAWIFFLPVCRNGVPRAGQVRFVFAHFFRCARCLTPFRTGREGRAPWLSNRPDN